MGWAWVRQATTVLSQCEEMKVQAEVHMLTITQCTDSQDAEEFVWGRRRGAITDAGSE